MSEILEQLEQLQEQLKNAESKRLRLEGQLEVIKTEIKELGFNSVNELKEEKSRLLKEITQKELILDSNIQNFKNQFGDLLNNIGKF